MRFFCLCGIFLLGLAVFLPSFQGHAASKPDPLQECHDFVLQKGLDDCLRDLGLEEAVRRKQLALALVDVTDPGAPRLAMANGHQMMYAASLPKIAILLGAFEQAARGNLDLDDSTIATLTDMIRVSSNRAATEILNKVGKEALIELLESERYRLYDSSGTGGLWVGKEYGKSGAYRRDPLFNLSHGATPFQVARFYYMLQTGQLVSPEMSRAMKEILSRPGISHKFVKALNTARPGSTLYRKSGKWRDFHADSVLVERDGRSYIAVGLAHSDQGEWWLRKVILGMDDLIFKGGPSVPTHADAG
ncbi:MAG: serine hydrolase [Desulfovibrionales bacterium]